MSDFPKISYSDGGVHVTVDLRALDQRMREAQQWLGDVGFDPVYGARPLKRLVQSTIEDALARRVFERLIEPIGSSKRSSAVDIVPTELICRNL